MPLNRRGRKELKLYKQKHSVRATRQLLQEDNAEGAAQALKKAKLSSDILALHVEPSRRLFFSLVFALLCGFLVSAAYVWHPPNPRINLDLKTYSAALRLAKNFHWQSRFGLETDGLLVDGQVVVEALGMGLTGSAERLEAMGNSITVQWIKASQGALLEVERGDGFVDLYLSEGILQGQVELQDTRLRLVRDNRPEIHPVSGSVPESLTFKTADQSGAKVRLRLKTAKDWRLDTLQVSGMTFQHEAPPRSGNFVSSIVKGDIELPEIKRKLSLLENDWLHMEQAASTRLHLTFAAADNDSFDLLFQGRAHTLKAGPVGVDPQDLTPSLLTYLYHQQQLSFFWGSLVFVYGLLWSLRNVLKKG